VTDEVTLPPTGGDDEAPCSSCTANKGLCRFHARHVLPQIALPSWPKLIGEPYVCTDPAHEDHVRCVHSQGPTPRAECSCHNCSQTRWARARASEHPTDAETAIAVKRVERRRARKLDKAAGRLVNAMHGAFSRSRPSRSAA
jgi:hypothetical protein